MSDEKKLIEWLKSGGADRFDPRFSIPTPDPAGAFQIAQQDELSRLRSQLETARKRLNEQDQFIRGISEGALLIGRVVAVQGKRVLFYTGGSLVYGNDPPRGCKPGDAVTVIPQSRQINEVIQLPPTGQVATVETVEGSHCTVSAGGGMSRSVIVADGVGALKRGDHVIVDDTGHIIIAKTAAPSVQAFEEETNVSWADIGGLDDAKEALREAIEYPARYPDLYRQYGKTPSRGVLLYGPPGCGKTMLGKATATSLRTERSDASGGFIYVKGPELLNKWLGETESGIRKLFDRAREYKQRTGHAAVLFIDEADALLGRRENQHALMAISHTVVPQFLSEMDGLTESGAFVLLSTNRPDTLDSAVVRDGRIDRKVFVGRPDQSSASEVLALHMRARPVAEGLDPAELCANTIDLIFSDETKVREFTLANAGNLTLYLRDLVSGAVLAGIANRATERALKRDRAADAKKASGIGFKDMREAVLASARELADTDLREDIQHAFERSGLGRQPKPAEAN